MDDLAKKLSEILSDDESMAKLSSLADSLGLGKKSDDGESGGADGKTPDLSFLSELLSSSEKHSGDEPKMDINPESLIKISRAMSAMKSDDKDVILLRAIKPFISDERKHKVDEAVKIMKLLALLPLIKDSGFLGGIL